MNKLIFRIILDIVIFFCIFHAWWFLALPLAIFSIWKFSYFIEIIFIGIIYDSLFGFVSGFGIQGYIGTIVSIFVFIFVTLLKRVVRK